MSPPFALHDTTFIFGVIMFASNVIEAAKHITSCSLVEDQISSCSAAGDEMISSCSPAHCLCFPLSAVRKFVRTIKRSWGVFLPAAYPHPRAGCRACRLSFSVLLTDGGEKSAYQRRKLETVPR